jgi:prepilin-type N-terminal cleavage/methylation domain-containing protein
MTRRVLRPRPRRAGFTLVELIAAMTIGLIVLASATSFAINTWITQSRGAASEDISRRARYLGMSFQRDIGEVGVAVKSRPMFSSLIISGDTVGLLRVPTRDTVQTPTYFAKVTTAPPVGQGTCGANCVDVIKNGLRGVEIRAGEVFLVDDQGTNEKRVLLALTVTDPAPTDTTQPVRITYLTGRDSLYRWYSKIDAGINWSQVQVKRLALALYFRDSTNLFRAERIASDGTFSRELLASGVSDFQANYIFVNGTEADFATPGSATQNYCQIAAIRFRATVTTDRPSDPRVARAASSNRVLQWVIAARNLIYERNALRGANCV